METKRIDYLAWLGWVLLFAVLFFRGCNPNPQFAEKIKVVTKEVKGKTIIKTNILHIPITKKVRDTAGVGFYVSQIDKLFEENNKMQNEFIKMDSLQQIEAYNKAIEINAFKQSFDDKYINAQVSGEVSGNIHAIKFDYTIKPQELKVDAPKLKNNFYLGINVANTLKLDKPLFNANLCFQNKRGNILRLGYDSESRILIGYDISILKFNR